MSNRRTMKSENSLSERITEKAVVIRGQLARRVHQTAEIFTNLFGNFTVLRYESIPEGIQRDHVVMRGFLEGIRRIQVRLDIRKTLWDAKMNIERLLETAIHLEAVTWIEDEEKEPWVTMLKSNNWKNWLNQLFRSTDCFAVFAKWQLQELPWG